MVWKKILKNHLNVYLGKKEKKSQFICFLKNFIKTKKKNKKKKKRTKLTFTAYSFLVWIWTYVRTVA